MTSRIAVALASVVLLVGLAGCSGEAAAPATPTSSSAVLTPVVIEPGSSSAASAPAVSSSVVPPSPSSVGVPTPSVIDVPTPTAPDPWPADLTPEQVVDAQAALEVYTRYQDLVNRAGSEPGRDWSVEASAVATAVAEDQLIDVLKQIAAQGLRTSGTSTISPKVITAEPALVVINDCVDSSDADFIDPSGQVITAPNAPGTYYRHAASAQVVQLADGTWRVAIATDDWNTTC